MTSAPPAGVHHSAICTGDVDRALRFWRDGMGLVQQFDVTFGGAWRELFNAPHDSLRSIFLADPATPRTGIVELVVFADCLPMIKRSPQPRVGFFLLSFERADVAAALARLAEVGFSDGVRRIAQPVGNGTHVPMAVITAPDGVLVELIGPAA